MSDKLPEEPEVVERPPKPNLRMKFGTDYRFHFEEEELRFGYEIAACRNLNGNLLRDAVGKLLRKDSVFEHVLLVDRNGELMTDDVIHLPAARKFDLGIRMTENPHHV